MDKGDVIFVKIYIVDSPNLLNSIVDYIKNQAKIYNVNVFRAVCDYNKNERSLSGVFECNVTIEFYDVKEKVEPALKSLSQMVKRGSVMYWNAKAMR